MLSIGLFCYFILNMPIDQILLLIFIGLAICIIGDLLFKKTGSKFERIIMIIIGIIYILTLINSNDIGLYYLYFWTLFGPFSLLEWTGEDKNNLKYKKNINMAFWFGIFFIILLIIWSLFLIGFYLYSTLESSLLEIILLGIGTFISLGLILEIKKKYFKDI